MATIPARLAWRRAKVLQRIQETPRVASLAIDVPDWVGHRAGQHLGV